MPQRAIILALSTPARCALKQGCFIFLFIVVGLSFSGKLRNSEVRIENMATFSSINNAGLDLIKHFEGFSESPYNCPGGKQTIGYGHTIRDGEEFSTITRFEAEEILRKDIDKIIPQINHLITVPLNANQASAIVSFVYNLGVSAFAKSALLTAINLEKHGEVPAQLLRWKYAGGRELKGLLLRRLAEAQLYVS